MRSQGSTNACRGGSLAIFWMGFAGAQVFFAMFIENREDECVEQIFYLVPFRTIRLCRYLLYCFQCYVLWYIYLFSILVDRASAAAVACNTKYSPKKIPSGFWSKKKLMSRWIRKVAEIKILTILSHVTGPVELNEMLQHDVLYILTSFGIFFASIRLPSFVKNNVYEMQL